MNFKEYTFERNMRDWDGLQFLFEATEEAIEQHQPQDGKWIDLDSDYATYRFNVAGDPCGSKQTPCYVVNISGSDTDVSTGVSIAFSRQGSYGDTERDEPYDVLLGVQKAIHEYIKIRRPAALRWAPVSRSKPFPKKLSDFKADFPPCPPGGCKSAIDKYEEAKRKWQNRRASIYDNMTKVLMFPEKYVSPSLNYWVRRDLYDKLHAKHGYPEVPSDLTKESGIREKSKSVDDLRNKTRSNSNEIDQKRNELASAVRDNMAEERREKRAEKSRSRLEALRPHLEDPTKNPDGLKIGDKVRLRATIEEIDSLPSERREWWINNSGSIRRILRDNPDFDPVGVIEDISFTNGRLNTAVKFNQPNSPADDYDYYVQVPMSELTKNTDRLKSEREESIRRRVEQLYSDPDKNPEGIKVGDDVLFVLVDGSTPPDLLRGRGMSPDGVFGTVRRIRPVSNKLVATVEFDADKSLSLHAKRYAGFYDSLDWDLKGTRSLQLKKFSPQAKEEYERRSSRPAPTQTPAPQTEAPAAAAPARAPQEAGRPPRIQRVAQRERELNDMIQANLQKSVVQELMRNPRNAYGVKPGDEVEIMTQEEADAAGVGNLIDYSIRPILGRKGLVIDLSMRNFDMSIMAYIKVKRSTIEQNVPIGLIKAEESEMNRVRRERAERRSQYRAGLISGELTGGRNIGDVVTVQSGPHAGKRGRIFSWRASNNNYYANIDLMMTPETPTGGRISVNVRLLAPTTESRIPQMETSSRAFGFASFLMWRRSYN